MGSPALAVQERIRAEQVKRFQNAMVRVISSRENAIGAAYWNGMMQKHDFKNLAKMVTDQVLVVWYPPPLFPPSDAPSETAQPQSTPRICPVTPRDPSDIK